MFYVLCVILGSTNLLTSSADGGKNETCKQVARALHVHQASDHDDSYGAKEAIFNSISVPNFVTLAQSIPKSEEPIEIYLYTPGGCSLHPWVPGPPKDDASL